jgi:hypothetical protein
MSLNCKRNKKNYRIAKKLLSRHLLWRVPSERGSRILSSGSHRGSAQEVMDTQ